MIRERCNTHQAQPSRHACAACADAYEAARDAQIARDLEDQRTRGALARIRAQHNRACTMCDDNGRLDNGLPCLHDPNLQAVTAAGVAACREALACPA